MKTLILILLCLPWMVSAQKEIYIPNEWQQPNGLEYSFDRSFASDNFIVFWGPLAGDDPTQAPTEIAFDPVTILNMAEELYRFYIDTIQFVNDDAGLISQYKIILVMLHTWPDLEGWAFGGNYDGIVGAMWMHPHAASSGPTLAHEFTHTLQNYTWMMNPGHGFIDSSYVGFFWETHAEFMSMQRYPSVAREFDMARWLNTCQFHWSSTRHHYQAFIFLQFLKERDGITIINRLWNESIIGEHPLETYKRLKGIDQERLNDLFAEYAMRNVTWDYAIQEDLQIRMETLPRQFVAHETIIPEVIDTIKGWYQIPNHLAPQDYGYNVIRLYPGYPDGCVERYVHINVKQQPIFPGYLDQGLRFGLVAVDEAGQPRYSEIYSPDEIKFQLETDENELYLVVVGAPRMHHNYAYEIGFPKIYRYPYEFRIAHAKPEGYQPGFNAPPDGVPGALHVNGGGFVATSAFVSPTAYVGSFAQVLDNAQVLENAIIDDYAVIRQNAIVSDRAIIDRYAIVGENARVSGDARVTDYTHVYGTSQVYDSASIEGSSLIFFTNVYENARLKDNVFCWGADLHGDVLLGGDAEFFSECFDGTYYQVDFAYNRFCDGLDDHPANQPVTDSYHPSKIMNSYTLLCNVLEPNYFLELYEHKCPEDTIHFNGQAITEEGTYTFEFMAVTGSDSIVTLYVSDFPGVHIIFTEPVCSNDTIWIDGIPLIPGIPYDTMVHDPFFGCEHHIYGVVEVFDTDTTILVIGNTLEVQQPSLFAEWYDCETNQPVGGVFGKTYTPEKSGYYKARLITVDSCDVFTECQYVIGTSVAGPGSSFDFNFYPNPVKDQLVIDLGKSLNASYSIKIADPAGRVLKSVPFQYYSENILIDVSYLISGLYMIRISNNDNLSYQEMFFKAN